jgi:xanthine dehydrogenase small subunit
MLAEIEKLSETPVEIRAESFGETHLVACPATLDDALAFLAEHPAATIVAGATDIGVRVNKSQRLPAAILDLNRVDELESVTTAIGEIHAGARASWTTLLAAFADSAPEFARIISIFGAPQIRHVGTIGGNIANASPIADSLPFLMVMESTLALARLASASRIATREVNINDFYLGYKQIDLQPGELIAQVRIPLPQADDLLRLYKVSRRRDLDIAGFTAAIRLRLDGETIAASGIALGAVGPTVIRPRQTEDFLVGRKFSEETMRSAGELAVEEITPIDDVRGAAEYRRQLTRNIFLKFYHQTQGELSTA